MLELAGPLRPILTAERTALNFLGRLSGVATLTAQFVTAAHESNPSVAVLDTRKTTPGLRLLEKAAVRAGGGTSHRFGLSDAVLVKDNHLAGTSIADAVRRARALWPGRMVEIECDALDQVAEAARAGADAVLLDNMDPGTVVEAIAVAHLDAPGPILTEVSGGVTLATIGAYAAAGPDRISVGALTHSAPVLDLGLDLLWTTAGTGRRCTARKGVERVLLVIDVGNTETVIGLYAPDGDGDAPAPEESIGVGIGTEHDPTAPRGLTHHWRLSTVPSRTPDEHAVLLTQLLDLEGLDISTSVSGIAVCSSVPARHGELRQMASRWFSELPSVVLGPGTKSGMPILYDNPKEVGADRIADAVGAYDLYGGPCVVVDMGTATTVEAISANGEYMGGAITPGVGVSLDALYQSAAALRRVELVEPRSVIGRSTVESIEVGHALRLRRPGRRAGPALHGGARARPPWWPREGSVRSSRRIRTPLSTWSPG